MRGVEERLEQYKVAGRQGGNCCSRREWREPGRALEGRGVVWHPGRWSRDRASRARVEENWEDLHWGFDALRKGVVPAAIWPCSLA